MPASSRPVRAPATEVSAIGDDARLIRQAQALSARAEPAGDTALALVELEQQISALVSAWRQVAPDTLRVTVPRATLGSEDHPARQRSMGLERLRRAIGGVLPGTRQDTVTALLYRPGTATSSAPRLVGDATYGQDVSLLTVDDAGRVGVAQAQGWRDGHVGEGAAGVFVRSSWTPTDRIRWANTISPTHPNGIRKVRRPQPLSTALSVAEALEVRAQVARHLEDRVAEAERAAQQRLLAQVLAPPGRGPATDRAARRA